MATHGGHGQCFNTMVFGFTPWTMFSVLRVQKCKRQQNVDNVGRKAVQASFQIFFGVNGGFVYDKILVAEFRISQADDLEITGTGGRLCQDRSQNVRQQDTVLSHLFCDF